VDRANAAEIAADAPPTFKEPVASAGMKTLEVEVVDDADDEDDDDDEEEEEVEGEAEVKIETA
jgi:hypothetical protein